MDFGMPTLIGLAARKDCAALCRELGLDFVELNVNLPAYQPGMIDAARQCRAVLEAKSVAGLRQSVAYLRALS